MNEELLDILESYFEKIAALAVFALILAAIL